MIAILYPPGGYGSMLEFCLRNFSNEFAGTKYGLSDNGSVHNFSKEAHLVYFNDFKKIDKNTRIITPVYPTYNYTTPINTILVWKHKFADIDNVIFINCQSINQVLLVHLSMFHKETNSFLESVLKDKPKDWNPQYQTHKDMRNFEIREALSFYIDSADEYLNLDQQVPDHWFSVTPTDILYNLKSVIVEIFNYCNLSFNENVFDEFYNEWFIKQKYILTEFNLVRNILQNFSEGKNLEWEKLSILAEAIIQSSLRKQNIELACYNLDVFPSSIDELKKYFL